MTRLSYVMSLMPPRIIRDLDLERHGYKLFPMGPAYQAWPDGRSLTLYDDDARRNHEQVSKFSKRDADAMVRWDAWLEGLAAVLGPCSPDPAQIGSRRPSDVADLLRLALPGPGRAHRRRRDPAHDHERPRPAGRLVRVRAGQGEPGHQRGDRHLGRARLARHRVRDGPPLDRRRRRRPPGQLGLPRGRHGGGLGRHPPLGAVPRRHRAHRRPGRAGAGLGRPGHRGGLAAARSCTPRWWSPPSTPDHLPGAGRPGRAAGRLRHRHRALVAQRRGQDQPGPGRAARLHRRPRHRGRRAPHRRHRHGPVGRLHRAGVPGRQAGPGRDPAVLGRLHPHGVRQDPGPRGHPRHVAVHPVVPARVVRGPPHRGAGGLRRPDDRLLRGAGPQPQGRILHRDVVGPWQMEQEWGWVGGNIFHGELSADQLFHMRPAPGYADYRSPIAGLYQASSATHGGGGVCGIPGWQAYRAMADRRATAAAGDRSAPARAAARAAVGGGGGGQRPARVVRGHAGRPAARRRLPGRGPPGQPALPGGGRAALPPVPGRPAGPVDLAAWPCPTPPWRPSRRRPPAIPAAVIFASRLDPDPPPPNHAVAPLAERLAAIARGPGWRCAAATAWGSSTSTRA